jgi:hypothetical protein
MTEQKKNAVKERERERKRKKEKERERMIMTYRETDEFIETGRKEREIPKLGCYVYTSRLRSNRGSSNLFEHQ